MGVLVDGKSKLGSTEDEGIGGDPVASRHLLLVYYCNTRCNNSTSLLQNTL